MTARQPPVPQTDPTPIFEHSRGVYATTLVVAAVCEFDLFNRLANGPLEEAELGRAIGLAPRAANVLLVALAAMGLLVRDQPGRVALSALAREHLVSGGEFDVSGYLGMSADSPAVREIVERLKTNRPAGAKPQEQGVAFLYREGISSAMEQEAAARRLTLALAGRAKNVAPVMARRIPLDNAKMLLDVGGGTGIYSIACLQHYPQLRAIVWDRPQVLKVAGEFARAAGVEGRVQLLVGDMFADPVPPDCDVMLLSNILHDWDVPECKALIRRLGAALPAEGTLLIHDVYLSDALDGPLAVALYSANLFCVTEGRAYSAAEYRSWLGEAGLAAGEVVPTLVHCGILLAAKRASHQSTTD